MINSQNKLIAKKSLGQNFLRSDKVINDIVNSVSEKYITDLKSGEIEIVEVGGGEGVITKALLEKGYKVNVLELDQRAVSMMNSNTELQIYTNTNKLKIFQKDVTETDFGEIVNNKKYIVIGNIPYYITGLILRHTFEQKVLPLEVIYMTQKEVTDRVVADDDKQGILPLSVQAYGNVERVAIVKAENFTPAPRVDSAILKISNIRKTFENKAQEQKYFLIIKTAFKHPRKIALSNLKKYLTSDKGKDESGGDGKDDKSLLIKVEKYFTENNLELKRAEDIPLFNWLALSKV